MGKLMNCGVCCMILSIWAIIQLGLMGVFFKIEAVSMIHDAEAHEYEDHEEFMDKTKQNYAALARNCWITAVIYVLTLIISIVCIRKAKIEDKKIEARKLSDELSCSPQPLKKKKLGKEDD